MTHSELIKTTTFVSDCTSVEEFIRKYYKRLDRDLAAWGKDHMKEKIASREEDVKRFGSTEISRHDSTTGYTVAYRPTA